MFKKIGRAFLAAISSPTAVKEEKNLFTFVLIRVLLAAGASDGLVQIARIFVKA